MKDRGCRRALLSTLRYYLAENWSIEFECVGRGTTPVLPVWHPEITNPALVVFLAPFLAAAQPDGQK